MVEGSYGGKNPGDKVIEDSLTLREDYKARGKTITSSGSSETLFNKNYKQTQEADGSGTIYERFIDTVQGIDVEGSETYEAPSTEESPGAAAAAEAVRAMEEDANQQAILFFNTASPAELNAFIQGFSPEGWEQYTNETLSDEAVAALSAASRNLPQNQQKADAQYRTADLYGDEVLDTAKGFFYTGPKNAITGVWDVVTSPIETAKGIGNAILNPIDTAQALWADVVEKASNSEGRGELAFDVVSSLVAAFKADKLRKAGKMAKPKKVDVDVNIADANKQINVLQDQCFAPETLVATPDGPREIKDIRKGDTVLAYDHESGTWRERHVEKFHENIYEGPLLTIHTEQGPVRTTIYHPFWVLSGRDLEERSAPRELSDHEDEGLSLQGRWVNSHELRCGDILIGQDGSRQAVLKIEQEFVQAFLVHNLTISEDHTFAVGADALLVHNTAKCDVEGIYEFPDNLNSNKPYVGQSGDIPGRLRRHELDGRMTPGTETTTEVLGGKTARELAEHNRIQSLTNGQRAKTSDVVSNLRDPIGPGRRPKLGLPDPTD
ncbi:Hint domain-containing protein [Adhaeretor mobilis]|uniref:Hint domain-containing protein n=1 Tax=Adhaeretor mobilis TaxID=1930276 RepID=A0A517N0D8_9BACT|nr:Hint domain-containing protein [Adhaeretor mobilis]QDT00593.1 hypothetical protein HG15A2_39320 [Adhaeretor mobilis]